MAIVDDNLFPKIIIRESANDGSDFSNPAADYRVLFLGEDGALHLRDSAGTVTSVGGSGTGYFKHATATRTAGSYTLNSTTEASVDTGLDLTVAAATGDVITVNINGLFGIEAQIANLDVCTVVSASPVNYFGAGLATTAQGLLGWSKQDGGIFTAITGSVTYVVQAGDISGGNVLLRLRYKVNANSVTLYGTTALAFKWSAVVNRPT